MTDSSGAVLPGVTVTAASEAVLGGSRTAVTDENGVYRFPALPPGTYSVKVELSGFRTGHATTHASSSARPLRSTPSSNQAASPRRSKSSAPRRWSTSSSSAAQKNLTEEILEFIPYSSRFGPDAIMLAPGVNPNNLTAYGSGGESSNAYMIDGVDTSDPDGARSGCSRTTTGSRKCRSSASGAPAEYGGFTGVASNSLIRSGSNRFSGLFETLYQNEGMIGDNIRKKCWPRIRT